MLCYEGGCNDVTPHALLIALYLSYIYAAHLDQDVRWRRAIIFRLARIYLAPNKQLAAAATPSH